MDSGETVAQQPVSTFSDMVCNVPNSRDGPAVREAASPVAFRVKPAAAPALQEQEHDLSMRGTPTAVQCQEVTERIDDIRESTEILDGIVAVEKIVDTSIIPVGKSVDAVDVQQRKETVDIEVEITAPVDTENRSIEPPVLVASNMPQVEGHVELLIVQAGGKSDGEGIAVEVVLNEASPPVSGVELLPLGEDRGGPREVPTSIELVMEPADVGIVGNVAENGTQQCGQTSSVDCIVEIESAFVGGAHTSVSSTAVSLVDDDQGVGESGTKAKESKGLDAGSISELEQKIVDEVVISVTTAGDVAETAERNSAPALSFEEETSIGEPQFTNNLEEVAHKLAGNIVAFGNADASSGMGTVEEVVPPVEASDSALNATDPSTAGVSDINVQMLESLQVDHHVHISATGEGTLTAEDTLNASDSLADLMEGSTEMTTLVAESSENIKAHDLVDTVTAQPILNGKEFDGYGLLNPEDVGDASVEERKIVTEKQGIVGSEESTEVEVLAELFVVPAPGEPGNTLNADDPLTSSEMDISAEQSSIFVHLDASSDVITSETLEAAVLLNGIEGVKPATQGAIPSADDLVAPVDDGGDVAPAIGDKESTDEPIVFESALNDSSDIAMPDIVDASAEGEQVVLEELGTISRSTSALTTNELKEEKFSTGVDDTEEDLPFVDDAGLIGETPKAIGPEEGEKLLNSEKIKVNEIQETLPETAVEVQIVNATLILDQENAGMEGAEKTQNEAVMFQETMTIVKMDPGIHSDDAVNNAVNAVDEATMAEKEDTQMANVPEEREGDNANVTEFTEPQEFAAKDDLINAEEVLVAVEETIDTTTVVISTGHGNGEAAAEDVDGPGGLIGVGSSVESSGLTITEIVVEESRAEQRSLWAISEPLVTPPEEEIIEAIGDLRTTVDDDIADRKELPKGMEGSVLEVTTADDVGSELNDLQTDVDELARSSETTGLQDQHVPHKDRVLDDLEQPEGNHNDTVVGMVSAVETGEEAKPLDLVDAPSPLVTATKVETGAAVGITVCPPVSTLVSSGEELQSTDVGAEIAVESAVEGHKDNIVTIAEADKDTYSIPSDVSLEALDVMVVVDGNSVPALESGSVSISVTSYDADKLSSIDDSAVDDTQETVVKDNSNAAKGGAADVLVASSTNELGLGLEAALDSSSALISEAKSMVLAEATGVAPVVEMAMDGQVMEKGIESALDVSTDILDGLPVGEALDRNEKKRAREEEVAVAEEDKEKTTKTAKTSNGEISALNDAGTHGVNIDAKIAEDVQVDKKRSRDDLESGGAEPDISIQTKALKTGIVDDDASPLCCKADTEEEADDAEECVEMEDEEEVQVKIVNGAGLESTFPRYKKRKIALFLGYSGAGYQGMQKNPGAITIEGELEEALFRAGAIAESNYGQPQKLDWRRAARTDKGVSAVGQVVSGCFFIDPPGFIERVNSHLPKQIRVYGYKRATAGFNAKKLCDRRKYEYVLPVYAFDPSVHLDRETAQALAAAEKVESVTETDIKTAFTQISGPAGEGDASVVIDSEMREGAIADENGVLSVADPGLKTADNIAETVGISIKAASNDGSPKIEGKEDNQIPSSTISAITKEATAVTEIAQDDIAAGVPLQTQEVLVETKEVTKVVIDVSSEAKETLDEGASTAPVEVLVETEEVLTERKEATETVIDLSTEEKKEALDEKVKKSTYKFGEVEFNRLNRILAGFEGHHNFHNFTVRTKATDPSANRYILSFGVEKTFTMDGIEFVRCSVVGQSFMLHQIRKMIGLAVAIMRGKAPESILATALRRDTKMNVPLAPELGLFLEECYYSAYNTRFHATHEEMSLNSFAAEADEFKKEFIYPHIVSTEARDSTFAMWLHSLNDRHYPDFVTAREAEKLVNSEGG